MTVNAVTDLPEPELADDADDLALPHGERDVLDGVRAIGAGGQPDGETAEVEDGRARGHQRRAILGSRVSRSASPSMFTASTVRARKTPGKRMLCG